MSSDRTYQVGVARADITPPPGIRLCGYTVREGVSHGVHAPLTATALVVRTSGNTVVLVALDLTLCDVAFATNLRERCAEALGLPRSHILVNLNHTHSAPNLPGWVPYDTDEQKELSARFAKLITSQTVAACKQALAQVQPARLVVGDGECFANINRRQRAPDGSVVLGEDPAGPCDHTVRVLRFDHLDGRPMAVAFRYSCHTITVGPGTNVISPDFIAPARNLIERELGCLSLFLQGCAGNSNPITGIDPDLEGYDNANRVGHMLGASVLQICAQLRTHRRRRKPTLVQSVAVFWQYGYELIAPGPPGTVETLEKEVTLALEPFPPLAEVEKERKEWAQKLASARDSEREADRNVMRRFDWWSQVRLDAARLGPNPATATFPLQMIRIGDVEIIALPFEPMAETAMKFGKSWVLGYSNGIVSYLPTPDISREGGMEAKLGYKNYMLPSELPGTWETEIVAFLKKEFGATGIQPS